MTVLNKKDMSAVMLKNTLKYLAIFSPIIFIVILIIFINDISLSLKQIKNSEVNEVSLVSSVAKNKFMISTSDLYILSKNQILQLYFQNKSDINKNYIRQLFALMMNEKKIYDQIRFIDNKGQEIARVNFENKSSEIVPSSKLQNKKNRYYFKDAIKLKNRDVFISPLDLNIENGKIERPLKPTLRLATPVFYNDTKKGIVIVNYYANEIINAVNAKSAKKQTSYTGYTYFLNSESYWFNHIDKNKNWGFMYPKKKSINFKNAFPNEWKAISASSDGQLDTENGIFTFETIFPALEIQKSNNGTSVMSDNNTKLISGNKYNWKIVNYVPKKELKKINFVIAIKYFIIFAISFIIILIVSYILASNEIKWKKIQKEIDYTVDSLFSDPTEDQRAKKFKTRILRALE